LARNATTKTENAINANQGLDLGIDSIWFSSVTKTANPIEMPFYMQGEIFNP